MCSQPIVGYHSDTFAKDRDKLATHLSLRLSALVGYAPEVSRPSLPIGDKMGR
jgi:hypothetical protein